MTFGTISVQNPANFELIGSVMQRIRIQGNIPAFLLVEGVFPGRHQLFKVAIRDAAEPLLRVDPAHVFAILEAGRSSHLAV